MTEREKEKERNKATGKISRQWKNGARLSNDVSLYHKKNLATVCISGSLKYICSIYYSFSVHVIDYC